MMRRTMMMTMRRRMKRILLKRKRENSMISLMNRGYLSVKISSCMTI